MSEEENKAIKEIYSIVYHDKDKTFVNVSRTKLNIILDLLFNQQQEIEEISREEINTIINCMDKHYISKNKIREKIKELKKWDKELGKKEENYAITVLKELLNE